MLNWMIFSKQVNILVVKFDLEKFPKIRTIWIIFFKLESNLLFGQSISLQSLKLIFFICQYLFQSIKLNMFSKSYVPFIMLLLNQTYNLNFSQKTSRFNILIKISPSIIYKHLYKVSKQMSSSNPASNQKIFKFIFQANLKTVTLALKFPCVVSIIWKRG